MLVGDVHSLPPLIPDGLQHAFHSLGSTTLCATVLDGLVLLADLKFPYRAPAFVDTGGCQRCLAASVTRRHRGSSAGGGANRAPGLRGRERAGKSGTNERNGAGAKTVLTQIGPVQVDVPRDGEGTFDPVIARKRQRRLDGIDGLVLSLTARSLTTGEISAHFAEVYGASVSKDTVSRITDKVTAEMAEWQVRPLDAVHPVINPRRRHRASVRCRSGSARGVAGPHRP